MQLAISRKSVLPRCDSLRSRVMLTVFVLVGLVGCLHTLAVYPLALHRANRVMDERLRAVALMISRNHEDVQTFRPVVALHYRYNLVAQVWKAGNLSTVPDQTSDSAISLMRQAPGYVNVTYRGLRWRVYTLTEGGRTIVTAQHAALAYETARQTALDSLIPTLMLFPLLWWGVRYGVTRGLRPLETVGQRLLQPGSDSALRLDDVALPEELLPFVHSINTLLGRLEQSVHLEKKFVAEAAHELRTPLSVLQIQVGNVQRASDPADLHERLHELNDSVYRAAALVHQLLGLARAEAGVAKGAPGALVDLLPIIDSIIQDYLLLANERGIDLGMEERAEHAVVIGDADELRIAVKNIVDNAVRYSREGARIDVSVMVNQASVIVEVADEGPGIPEGMLERVFDRFVRLRNVDAEGSGLGLAIVRTIVLKHKGNVALANRSDKMQGVVAHISLPRAA